jgi:hypothetical protein
MPYPYPGDEYRVVEIQVQNLLGPDLLVTSLSLEDVMPVVSASSPTERDILISSIAIKQLDTAIAFKSIAIHQLGREAGSIASREWRSLRLRRREIQNEQCRAMSESFAPVPAPIIPEVHSNTRKMRI